MTLSLAGRTVALAEGRQLQELVAMLEAVGAIPLRYPLLNILDNPDQESVAQWIAAWITNRFDLVLLFTGEAVRRLVSGAERLGNRQELLAAMTRTPILCRGPKPGIALRELGLPTPRTSSAPTSAGMIATLQEESLEGKHVGYTLYGSDNPQISTYLSSRGAIPYPVMPYLFAPASDDDKVAELILRLAAGDIDFLVLTSSPQVERLWQLAEQRLLVDTLNLGLQKTRVAAVGPLVAETLRKHNAPVHICPEQGWVMKNLVRQMVRSVSDA